MHMHLISVFLDFHVSVIFVLLDFHVSMYVCMYVSQFQTHF